MWIANIIIAAIFALIVTAQPNHQKCTDEPLQQAKQQEQSFNIIKTEGKIETDVRCTWTITAPDQQKVIIYLLVNGDKTQKQCVNVQNVAAKSGQDICGVQDQNTFKSSGPKVTITYPKSGDPQEEENFKVMYKIANSDNCADPPKEATQMEQSFNILKTEGKIGTTVRCAWTITAPDQQRVTVHLLLDGAKTEKQCVNVQNEGAPSGQDICGVQGQNTFTSSGRMVTVYYPKSVPLSEDVDNFKVIYQIANSENCADPPKQATANEQSFSILKTDGTIGTNVRCSWKIIAPESQNVTVYLQVNGSTTEKQCVNVQNDGAQSGKEICGKEGQNTFTSSGQMVTVTYPKSGEGLEEVPNFKVMYQIAGACRVAPWIMIMSTIFILSKMLLLP